MGVIATDEEPVMTEEELAAYEEGRRMYREGRDLFDVTEKRPYQGRRDAVKWAAEFGWWDERDKVTLEERMRAERNGLNL